MTQTHEEAGDAPNPELDGLSPEDRKETEEIIKDLSGESGEEPKKPDEVAPPKDDAPKKPEDGKPDEVKKPEEPKSEERRSTKLIPEWQKHVAEKQHAKREGELLAEIEALKQNPPKPSDIQKPEDKEVTPEQKSAIDEKVKEIAKDLDLDEAKTQKLLEAIAEKVQTNSELPADIKEMLADAQKLKQERDVEREEMMFSNDFDKSVLPEIKKEYGDDVADSVVADIKEKVKAIAYSQEYQKVPYLEIYRGKGDFRELVAPKRASAEASKGGFTQVAGSTIRFEDLSEEQVKSLSDDDFEKYSEHMAKSERRAI